FFRISIRAFLFSKILTSLFSYGRYILSKKGWYAAKGRRLFTITSSYKSDVATLLIASKSLCPAFLSWDSSAIFFMFLFYPSTDPKSVVYTVFLFYLRYLTEPAYHSYTICYSLKVPLFADTLIFFYRYLIYACDIHLKIDLSG